MNLKRQLFQKPLILAGFLMFLSLLGLTACGDNTPAPLPTQESYPSFSASPPLIPVTPPPLGVAESALKATGFSGESAKVLLDELIRVAGSRVVATEGEQKALKWLEGKYQSYGYTRSERQKFPTYVKDAFGQNLITTRPGPSPTAPVLIFGAHFDTVGGTVGANDNGSGTAITVELAHLLFAKFPDYELRFINFSGEEIGLRGSGYYVSQLSALERERLVGYINLDNIGVGDQLFAAGNPQLVALAIDVANRNGVRMVPLDLINNSKGSDHQSFVNSGLKAVGLGRWLDPQIHQPGDTPDRIYSQALLVGGGTAILVAQALTGQKVA